MEVEVGFRKANINNLPSITSEMVYNYCAAHGISGKQMLKDDSMDFITDYVQLRRIEDVCELSALVFQPNDLMNSEKHANVTIKFNETLKEFIDWTCSYCDDNFSCLHIISFVFWLHLKSTARIISPTVCDFWGHEFDSLVREKNTRAYPIRDLLPVTEARAKADLDILAVSESDGQAFLEAVLDDLDNVGLRDAALYRQSVDTTDDFDSILIHHIMLSKTKHNIVDANSFVQYMDQQGERGIFDNLNEITKNVYKLPLWLEVQYMRVRCSLMHRIASRKDAHEDEEIFQLLFCKNRDRDIMERQNQKQHKRFILKQTEKLENKTYLECGLQIHESYPFIVASPDGITDDHIVEIKSPKTEEEFEKYLVGRETIAPKYMAQIQTQMFVTNVSKALYCVLSPTFDTNGALHYVWVHADHDFVTSLIGMADDFWKEVVYPRLEKIYYHN